MKTKIHRFGTTTYIIKTYFKNNDDNVEVTFTQFIKLSNAKKFYEKSVKLFGIENVTFLSTKQIMLIDENGDFIGM